MASRLRRLLFERQEVNPPAFVASGQFKEVSPGTTTLWRNNDLLLVPARLYVHKAAAGEKIRLTLGDRDAIVMIK